MGSAQTIKAWIKRRIMYSGREETTAIRMKISASHREGWPYCPPDEGDVLFHFARKFEGGQALEIGMATGSTAGYLLAGMRLGMVTSIDYDQDDHARMGEMLVRDLGCSERHTLIEQNSVQVLPELWAKGLTFDLIFLDGWKTFDHIWVDVFYCAKMLKTDGVMIFDDARMPAVRKCILLLERYYSFQRLNSYSLVGGWKQRAWHFLTSRSLQPPYVVLRKTCEIAETKAGSKYDFWAPF